MSYLQQITIYTKKIHDFSQLTSLVHKQPLDDLICQLAITPQLSAIKTLHDTTKDKTKQ